MEKGAPRLKRKEKEGAPGDFYVDEKTHTVLLSEDGHEHAEKLLGRAGLLPEGRSLYEPAYVNLMHHLNAALRAHKDRKSTRLNSSHLVISYAVFCLKKKKVVTRIVPVAAAERRSERLDHRNEHD